MARVVRHPHHVTQRGNGRARTVLASATMRSIVTCSPIAAMLALRLGLVPNQVYFTGPLCHQILTGCGGRLNRLNGTSEDERRRRMGVECCHRNRATIPFNAAP